MSEALEYFKQVYKEVPKWVQVMHDYNPDMLEAYTEIRSEAFKTDVLTDKEKDELVAAVNAGRLYDRSMVYHTQAASNKGSKLEDLIEYFLVAYVYKGKDALEHALLAVAQYINDKDGKNLSPKANYLSFEEIIAQLQEWFNTSFLEKVKESENPEETIMSAGSVSESRKYLAMVGMYITELDGDGAESKVDEAREHGVTEAELADLGYVLILTSGIPSWFELSDHLKIK